MISVEDLDSVDDPLELFQLASEAISQHQAEIDKLADIRARSIAALYARGSSYKELASTLGLSTPRVGQLVSANDAAAIEVLNAWAAIEHTMMDIIGATNPNSNAGPRNIYRDALRVLRQSKRFDEAARRDLEHLRQVRNAVVHNQGSVSVEEVEKLTDKAIYLNSLMKVILFDTHPRHTISAWTDESHERLESLQGARSDHYQSGWWTCAYVLGPVDTPPSLPKFRQILREVKGTETGWPVWLALDNRSGMGETIVGNTIECWLRDTEPADFWRADPNGRMFLLRRLEEDYAFKGVPAGVYLDLVLPIWRTGECLLHASRLAKRLNSDLVELEMEWHGLSGRELRSLASPRSVMPGKICNDLEVKERITVSASDIPDSLPKLVKSLVSPLFARFDFFEPRDDLYSSELHRMLNGS